MGMDSYLYRTTSEEQEKFYRISEEVARKRSEIEKEIEKTLDDGNVYLDFLKKKYPEIAKFERDDNFRVNIEKVITKDEIAKIDEIVENHNTLKQKYYDCDFELEKADVRGDELYYWRKAYGLHGYIVRNFWNKSNDNCVRIPLTKENLQQIVDDMEKASPMKPKSEDNPFGKSDYWDEHDLKFSLEMFRDTVANMTKDTIIYYYTCY